MMSLSKVMIFASGALLGFGAAITWAEDRAAKRYSESEEFRRRAQEIAAERARAQTESPVTFPETGAAVTMVKPMDYRPELGRRGHSLGLVVAGELTDPIEGGLYDVVVDPDYLKLVAVAEEGPSFEIIEEEDFFDEEDGREKHQVEFMVDGDGAVSFTMDMHPLDDCEDHLGRTILRDFYGELGWFSSDRDRVLYLRNHGRNADYEIAQALP